MQVNSSVSPLLHHLDVKRLIATLVTKGLKKQTIHNILTPFKEGYHHAIDDGIVSHNPVSNMGRLIKVKEDYRSHISPLTTQEVQVLLQSTKTHNIRRIDMSQQLLQTLGQLKETRILEANYRKVTITDWVFVWPDRFERMSGTTVLRLIYKALEKAKLRRVRLHDCRHPFASL